MEHQNLATMACARQFEFHGVYLAANLIDLPMCKACLICDGGIIVDVVVIWQNCPKQGVMRLNGNVNTAALAMPQRKKLIKNRHFCRKGICQNVITFNVLLRYLIKVGWALAQQPL